MNRIRKGFILLAALLGAAVLTGCSSGNEGTADSSAAAESETDAQKATLFFVRHGKTMFNTTGQVQGWSDTPLTDAGVEVAEQLGKGLSDTEFSAAFSSDMGRAHSTAEIVLEGSGNEKVDLVTLTGLREWCYGGYEGRDNYVMWDPIFEDHGLKFDEDWTDYAALTEQMSDEDIANAIAANDETGTAESYDEIVERSKEAMKEIEKLARKKGGNILIVSHGSEIPTILEIISPGSYKGEDIGNCSVTKVAYADGTYTVESIGDDSYLEKGQS